MLHVAYAVVAEVADGPAHERRQVRQRGHPVVRQMAGHEGERIAAVGGQVVLRVHSPRRTVTLSPVSLMLSQALMPRKE